ncbi:MAG: hypothetical protein ACI4J2_09785 [Ruminococcus sp.]
MDIKDEINVMLNSLKDGKPKAPEQPKKASPPPAPVKSIYDRMSVDELVTAITDEEKPRQESEPLKAKKPAEVKKPAKISESQTPVKKAPKKVIRGTSDNKIPQNILDMLGTAGAEPEIRKTPEVKAEKSAEPEIRKTPEVKAEKAAEPEIAKAPEAKAEKATEPEISKAHEVKTEKAAEPEISKAPEVKTEENSAADNVQKPESEEKSESAPESKKNIKKLVFIKRKSGAEKKSEPEIPPEEEKISEPEEVSESPEPEPEEAEIPENTTNEDKPATEQESADWDIAEIPEYDEEEEVYNYIDGPEPERKGFLSGLKSLFSRKKPAEDTEEEPEVPEENEPENEPEPSIFSVTEEEKEQAFPIETEPEHETNSESINAAAELVDAAIEAIEKLKLESSEEIAPESSQTEQQADSQEDEEIPENQAENATTDTTSDEDDSPEAIGEASLLIAGIREDAASAIAGIEAGMSDTASAEPKKSISEAPEETAPEAEPEQAEETLTSPEINIDIEDGSAKKKNRFTAALQNILDEDPAVLSGERKEKAEADKIDVPVKGKGRFKRNFFAFIGVIMCIFAAVGLVFSVRYGIRYFRSFTAGEDQKDGFAEVVYPAVIMDIESFAAPADLPSDQIISAALWSLVMSEEDMAKYSATFDIISVPAIDVEAYAAKLFGNNLPEIQHATVGSGELKFYYNEDTKSYNVPVNPITFTYRPKISSVSKTDDEYTIVVDYVKELPSWMENSKNGGEQISKTAEYKLHENNGSYTISSMTVLNVNNSL